MERIQKMFLIIFVLGMLQTIYNKWSKTYGTTDLDGKAGDHLSISACIQAEADLLYFADMGRRGIFCMPLSGGLHVPVDVPDAIKPNNPVAVAFDGRSKNLFFTQRASDALTDIKFIAKHNFVTGESSQVEMPANSMLDGLAYEPSSDILYYSDGRNGAIGVLSGDLIYHALLIHQGLDNPRDLAVDSSEGFLFWTDWSSIKPHIGRAFMDGSEAAPILISSILWPNGITIDRTGGKKHIYWCDAKTSTIERADLDGSNRRVILQRNAHFYGIVTDETYIYFTDWTKRMIQRIHKTGPAHVEFFGEEVDSKIKTRMAGIDISNSPLSDTGNAACSEDNGGCEHMCLLSGPDTRVCKCTDSYSLQSDGTSCLKVTLEKALVVSDPGKRGIFILDLVTDTVYRIRAPGNPKGISFDETEEKAFWVDSLIRKISNTCVHSECEVDNLKYFTEADNFPIGVALDTKNKRVYIVDEGQPAIKRLTYAAKSETLLVDSQLNCPVGIALDETAGMMYWSDMGDPPRIERASMKDGSGREVFVSTNLGRPTALAIDPVEKRLFWTDATLHCIQKQQLDGSDRQTLLEWPGEHLAGLTYGDNTLYFSISQNSSVYSLDLETLEVGTHGNGQFRDVFGLDFFSMHFIEG